MKKQDLAQIVNDIVGGTKTQSESVIKALFDAMAGEMAKGGVIDIAGFGKFEGAHKEARNARNPRTGEIVAVAAKRVPKFKAGKALKDQVAGK
jgi:DNA-binding protein HU-beta